MRSGTERDLATRARVGNVFPFGKPSPSDPAPPSLRAKPLATLSGRNLRRPDNVHDNRHTFIADLADGSESLANIRDFDLGYP